MKKDLVDILRAMARSMIEEREDLGEELQAGSISHESVVITCFDLLEGNAQDLIKLANNIERGEFIYKEEKND